MKKAGKEFILSIAGFIIAILANVFIPGGTKSEIYTISIFELYSEDLYRVILIAIIVGIVVSWINARKDKEKKKARKKKALFQFVLGIAIAFWDFAGSKADLLPQPFFPGPVRIAEAFLEDSDYVLQNTLYSFRLFAIGFILGVVFGIITGIIIGCFKKIGYWIEPILNICGVIPPVAWMPFALIIFPTSFGAAVFLLVICVWFPVASMTALGIITTPKVQFEAADILGASKLYRIRTVALPHAMPQIFTGITTAEAFAFTNLVMAEMMGQPGGLGYYINASKVWSAYYKVFAAIIVMAVLFSLIKYGIDRISTYVLRWQKGVVK